MKLVLVKHGETHLAVAADEIKLINKDFEEIPKEIMYKENTVQVFSPSAETYETTSEKEPDINENIFHEIRKMLATGNASDIEQLKEILASEPILSDSDPTSVKISENFYKGLTEIMEAINDFKKTTISKLDDRIGEIAGDALPETSDQLEAIVKATESATNSIIDITEQIQGSNQQIHSEMGKVLQMKDMIEDGIKGVVEVMENMTAIRKENDIHIQTILEALSFQDITGQRIFKIVELVKKMDKNLKEIVLDLGLKIKKKNNEADPETLKKGEELLALLKGPQENGIDQSEVDDIISKFL